MMEEKTDAYSEWPDHTEQANRERTITRRRI